MTYRKVHLGSTDLWWDEEEFLKDGDTPLAPPNHVSPDGETLLVAWPMISFAHAFHDEGIMRFGEKIGEIEDLVEGWVGGERRETLLLEYRLDVIGPPQYVARCPHCLKQCRWAFGRRNKLGGFILGFTPGSSYRTAVHDAVPHSVERCHYCQQIFSPHAMTLENWEPEGF